MAVNPMVAQFLQALATQQMQAPTLAGGEFNLLPMNPQPPPQQQAASSAPGEMHPLPIQQQMPQYGATFGQGEAHQLPIQPQAGTGGPMRPPEGAHGGGDPGFLMQDIMKRLAGQRRGGSQVQQPHQMPLQGAAGY